MLGLHSCEASAWLRADWTESYLVFDATRGVRLFYLSQPGRGVVKSDSRAKIRAEAKPGRAEALRPFGGGPT